MKARQAVITKAFEVGVREVDQRIPAQEALTRPSCAARWDEKAADRSLGVGLAADVPGIVGTDSGRLFVDDLTRRADPVATGDWLDVVGVDDLPAVITVAAIDAGPIKNATVGIALVGPDPHPVGVLVEIDHLLCLRCAGEEDQNGNCPHRRSTGGFTLVRRSSRRARRGTSSSRGSFRKFRAPEHWPHGRIL